MKKTASMAFVTIALAACGDDPSTFPSSNLSYDQVDREVGCNSPYGSEKKDDLFKNKYKNKWYIWDGVVKLSDSSSVSLDMNNGGIQDLDLETQGSWGYDLVEGQKVRVKFVLDTPGGCFLPFTGSHGSRLVVMENK